MGGGHPSWPQVKGPDGLLLMDAVWRSQSQASRCGCLWHTRNMRGADLLALSGVRKSLVGDAKGFGGQSVAYKGL